MADANAQYVTSPLSISPPLVESPSTLAFGDTLPRTATELSTPKPNAAWLGKQQQRQWIPDLNDPVLKDNRTLVLCFDGTGDQFDDDNLSIVQIMALLKKDDPSKQKVYYQAGVGTYKGATASTPGAVSKVFDLMIANTLGAHVRDGYAFLMDNYSIGDKICLFGFSRGAYTARALAGMLQKVGLLPAGNQQQLAFAYKMFRNQNISVDTCKDFKRTYSIDVRIEFCGVFDTVASVGIIPRYLPFVTANNCIRFFRHAIALDEHRSKFMPNFYKQQEANEEDSPDQCDDYRKHQQRRPTRAWFGEPPKKTPKRSKAEPSPVKREFSQARLLEYDLNAQIGEATNVLEVMFAGAHADIGGGSVNNTTHRSLARIPLRWMIRECFKAQTGIIFDMLMLRDKVGMDINVERHHILQPPKPLSPDEIQHRIAALPRPMATRRAGWRAILRFKDRIPVSHDTSPSTASTDHAFEGEAVEELMDALSPIYDQLRIAPAWWILEWAPLRQLKQQALLDASHNKESDFFWMINRGRGRKVFKYVVRRGIKVHRSVLTRLNALDHKGKRGTYVPLIRPNLHVHMNGNDSRLNAAPRSMTHDEWVHCNAPGLGKWFDWVVLDSSSGKPAQGVAVYLSKIPHGIDNACTAETLANGVTNADGRCTDLLPPTLKLDVGLYQVKFMTADYVSKTGRKCFYPWVEITFELSNPDEHHHIPLLLSPYGYTTYRGS